MGNSGKPRFTRDDMDKQAARGHSPGEMYGILDRSKVLDTGNKLKRQTSSEHMSHCVSVGKLQTAMGRNERLVG